MKAAVMIGIVVSMCCPSGFAQDYQAQFDQAQQCFNSAMASAKAAQHAVAVFTQACAPSCSDTWVKTAIEPEELSESTWIKRATQCDLQMKSALAQINGDADAQAVPVVHPKAHKWMRVLGSALAGAAAGSQAPNGAGFLGGMGAGYASTADSTVDTAPSATSQPTAPQLPSSSYSETTITPAGPGHFTSQTIDGDGNFSSGDIYIQRPFPSLQPFGPTIGQKITQENQEWGAEQMGVIQHLAAPPAPFKFNTTIRSLPTSCGVPMLDAKRGPGIWCPSK